MYWYFHIVEQAISLFAFGINKPRKKLVIYQQTAVIFLIKAANLKVFAIAYIVINN